MRMLRFILLGIATMSLVPGVVAQDSISRMESRMANTTAVLTDGSRTPAPTAKPAFPTLNQNGAAAACGPANCGRTFIGGMERLYLNPDFGDIQFEIDDNTIDYDPEWESGTRSTLGVIGPSGIGLRGRYFDYDSDFRFEDLTVDTDSNSVDGIFGTALLDIETFDLELTRSGCFRGWNTVASLGARYGHIEYDFQGTQLDIVDDSDSDVSTQVINRRFNGVGVTGALEGKRAVRCGSQLALYWNARGSAVFGDNEASNGQYDLDADIDGDIDVDIDTDSTSESETLLIGEFQVGFDYTRPIACIRSNVVVRGGFEYQVWSLDNVSELDGGSSTTAGNDPLGNKDLNLYGPVFSIGISR